MAQLAPQRSHPLGILYRPGIGQLLFNLTGPLKSLGEAITQAQVVGVAGAALEAGPLLAYF
jgi:hypothetical protein